MELLIDKKYLIRLERYTKFYGSGYDPFAARYVFAPPANAGLPDGYTVYIDAEKVEWERDGKGLRHNDAQPICTKELENNKTYRLDRPSDMMYVAQMTENREEGKRYKRYKYTAEELYALYQNVDLKTAELAVARVDIYLEGKAGNKHKVIYGNRIDETKYLVGKVQGCWFYCTELDTKRRINSHGVTLLGKIKPSDEPEARSIVAEAEKQIKAYKRELNNLYGVRNHADKVVWEVKHYLDPKNKWSVDSFVPKDEEVMEAIREMHSQAIKTMQLIDNKLSEETATLGKIEAELKEQLKKFIYE